MRRWGAGRAAVAAAAAAAWIAACGAAGEAGPAPPTPAGRPGRTTAGTAARLPGGDDATVERVVDGDTIAVAGGVTVRLIGIDTPETVDPRRPVQCFGREAARRTGELAGPGTAVRLVYDAERTDRYGRTLAYVYRRADGRFVNAALVRGGFAFAATYPPNVAHAERFVALQREAREAGRGLWTSCPAPGAPDSPAGPGDPGGTVPPAEAGCDPAYPDGCIPPPPPDLDCADVAFRRFRVLPPDPHGFDVEGDGRGCES